MKNRSLLIYLCILCFTFPSRGQECLFDEENLKGLNYRLVGPFRGGRVTAVCGIPDQIHTFYMGSTGGGIWKTEDAGNTWKNISDGFFEVGSIGSIAVSTVDPNVIYVGTGSACPRGNISIGKGIYKSTDGGASWVHVGLAHGGMIGKIEIHPKNPDIVFVAVLGNPFGPNKERGVYNTQDGGKNWKKIHFISNKTGAVDLVLDPTNPRFIYAAMWSVQRKPWTLIDGSMEGGIWKSSDGGDSWERIKGGLPQGTVGRSGIAISPANPSRIWVIQEGQKEDEGGLYRSDDRGKSWKKINRDHKLRQRAWYYNHLTAHPQNENTLFNMNVRFHRSIDGGKSFETISTPHGDNHALWINPNHPEIMIEGNDGGACVTLNGGKSWSSIYNQPTAEFYRITVDNQIPYRIYGAQQDNSTISVPSRIQDRLDPIQGWYSVGGGESGHIAVDRTNPNIVYAGTYIGQITRKNLHTGHTRRIAAYPQMHDGVAPRNIKYRFQWNAPIRISPHDSKIIYHCSQFVHRSRDGGFTWDVISPDLTTNKNEYQEIPGGPVQHDHTGVELYTTIFAFEESPLNPGELWTGSDDGLLHLSKDHGENWANITPPQLPEEGTINTIELSSHQPGRVLIAVYKYRENDFKPYIFLTNNYGKNWKQITNGIPEDHFVRVVREDPVRKGLLYAGTEFGMYISLNEGDKWYSFQRNLPVTPITDMVIKNNDLVVATQGRSFWILDDLSPLQHIFKTTPQLPGVTTFPIQTAMRSHFSNFRSGNAPDPAPNGAIIYFYCENELDSTTTVKVEIKDEHHKIRRTFSTKPDTSSGTQETLKVHNGLNRLIWDLKYEKPKVEKGAVFSLANTGGIKAPPGNHSITYSIGDSSYTQGFHLTFDPRWELTGEDLKAQYKLTNKAKNMLETCHEVIGQVRSSKTQLRNLTKRSTLKNHVLLNEINQIIEQLDSLEQLLIQNRSESGQDPINYPSMIDDQIAYLYSVLNSKDDRPGEGDHERLSDLEKEIEPYYQRWLLLQKELRQLNQKLKDTSIQVIDIPVKPIKP